VPGRAERDLQGCCWGQARGAQDHIRLPSATTRRRGLVDAMPAIGHHEAQWGRRKNGAGTARLPLLNERTMTMAVEIVMSSPIRHGGYDSGKNQGGPGTGHHVGPDWWIASGMDLGATPGAVICAAFDGHITDYKFPPPNRKYKSYGAEFSIRSGISHGDPTYDVVGAWYTHIEPNHKFGIGEIVRKGTILGTVMDLSPLYPVHLHMAVVEIIGTHHSCINLYDRFKTISQTGADIRVLFPRTGHASHSVL